jgi:hypothetical protein
MYVVSMLCLFNIYKVTKKSNFAVFEGKYTDGLCYKTSPSHIHFSYTNSRSIKGQYMILGWHVI